MESGRIVHRRMYNQRLRGVPFDTPEQAVGWLGAVQSQEYGPAKWSVGQRVAGVDDAAVERLVADGAILRTHLLRPTWHFVLPADIRGMLRVTAPRVHALNAFHYRQQGLDEAVLDRCTTAISDALRGGNHLTRTELGAVLEKAGITASGFRLAYILMNAELNAVVCSGALRGKRHTYALLDERVPPAATPAYDEALADLTLRYFTGHGPATRNDFKWWSSLTLAEIDRGLDLVSSRLESAVIDGRTCWFAASAPHPEPVSPDVELLQGFDEFFSYGETKYVVAPPGAGGSADQDRPAFFHAVILDGRLAGHWKRTIKKDTVILDAALYAPFDDAQTDALHAAADRHGRFLGLAATVQTTVAASA